MELTLNALWLVVALLSLGLWWRFNWRRWGAGRDRAESLRELIALCCALFIVFPVISLTDDLHAEALAMEDSNSSKRSLKNDSGTPGPAAQGPTPALRGVSVAAAAFSSPGIFVGLVSSCEIQPHSFVGASLSEGRAPPSSTT